MRPLPPPDGTCLFPTGCGPPGVHEALYRARDGAGATLGAEHRVPISDTSVIVRGGYRYERYWADGLEWDGDTHAVHVGVAALGVVQAGEIVEFIGPVQVATQVGILSEESFFSDRHGALIKRFGVGVTALLFV